MSSKTGPTNINNQDWSEFDFTRWNLDNLNLDPKTVTLSTWLRDVTSSPQGSQKLASGLAVVKAGALQSLTAQIGGMQKRLSAIDEEMKARVSTARSQVAALDEDMRATAAPAVVPADPESFQVVTKVVDQASTIGVPALQVRLVDAKSPQQTLATAATDQNGNAVLKLNREQTDALTKSGSSLAINVLTVNNKSVFSGGAVPAPRLNETGTVLAPIAASDDVAPQLDTANAQLARQQDLRDKATQKVEDLQTYYAQMKSDLQQEIQDTQEMVSNLQSGT